MSDPGAATIETADFTATLPRKRMGAGVLFTDEDGRVLLVEPGRRMPEPQHVF
jgi:hypothetical protein